MRIKKLLPYITLCIISFSGCKKTETEPSTFTLTSLQTSVALRDISFLNDTLGFICGGNPGESGTIWRTTDGGSTWVSVLETPGRCIYDADFLNTSDGYAGGDALLLLHTTDGGLTWVNVYENMDFSGWSEFIRPIRKVAFPNSRNIIAVGGDVWYKGLMCISHNWGENWFFKDYDNQLNDISIPAVNSTWVCGYGLMLNSEDSCSNLTTRVIDDDYFTAIDFAEVNRGLASGFNGGIYKTDNAGLSWTEVLKSSNTFDKRQHFNDICFISANRALAVGNNGLLLLSNDQGATWESIKTDTDADILAVAEKSDGEIWMCGTGGFLCRLRL